MFKGQGNRKRTCKSCGKTKIPACDGFIVGVNFVCSRDCAFDLGNKAAQKATANAKAKIDRKAREEEKEANTKRRERKKELKPLKYWQDKLQAVTNQWIVHVRDADKPCCTCGTRSPYVKYDAGHYHSIGRGGADRRRFEITNIHKQCSVNCNQHGAGMRAEYKEFIRAVYGQDHLEWLDGEYNFPLLKEKFPHWTDYEAEIIRYRKLLRDAGVTPCQ